MIRDRYKIYWVNVEFTIRENFREHFEKYSQVRDWKKVNMEKRPKIKIIDNK